MVNQRADTLAFDPDEELRRRRQEEADAMAAGNPIPSAPLRAEDIPVPVPAIGTPQGGFAPQITEVGDPGQTTRLFDPLTGRTGFKGGGPGGDQGFVMPGAEPFTAANDPALATGLADYMARMAARSDVNTEAGRAARAEALRYSDQGIRYGDPLAGQSFQAQHVFNPIQQPEAAAPATDPIMARLREGRPEDMSAILAGLRGPANTGAQPTDVQPTSATFGQPAGARELGIPGAQGFNPPAGATTLTAAPREPTNPIARLIAGVVSTTANLQQNENQNRNLLQSAIAGSAPQTGETHPDANGVTYPTLGSLRTQDDEGNAVTGTIVRMPDGSVRIWNQATGDYEDPDTGVWARYSR